MDVQVSSKIDEYSRDTAIIIWWLQSTSSDNGWVAPADGKIITRHLRDQARIIVGADIRMPQYVSRAFSRAIALRKRCQVWFEVGKRTTPENIASHRHFIEVLEDCYDAFNADDFFEKETSDEQDETIPLAHAFAGMMVEYLSSSDDVAEGSSRPSASRPSTSRPSTLPLPPPTHDELPQSYNTFSKAYYDVNPKWDVGCQTHCLFGDVHFLRAEINTMLTEVAAGTLPLPVASIVIMHCLKLVGEMEQKVYSQFHGVYQPTGRPYEDMAAVLYDMMSPKVEGVTGQQETAEYSEEDEFVFLGVGRSLKKLTQTAHLTKEFEWPPPLPEARLYCMMNRDFILSHSFERSDIEDAYLSQIGMDIHLGEILVRDSYVGNEATRLSHTPLQAALAGVWKSGVVTVQSVFAALIVLDFQSVVNKPTPELSAAQMTVSDVKRRVYRDNSFYPFSPKGSTRSEDRAVFDSGEFPPEYVQ
ncbi:hypothetical protein PG993_015026 [Apiospora rasikravindrae]|uniref:DUF6604 domain-containing protein n=1 Tax=Apiospora rasikravindrae TaxID=990691 RepID=A0ABR1RPS1_9PEZI